VRIIGALPEDHPVHSWHDLCLFLGGDVTSFTGKLLELIAKADSVNKERLALAFPREVRAWGMWQAAPLHHVYTATTLEEAIVMQGAPAAR
jgi:hypothetical protein